MQNHNNLNLPYQRPGNRERLCIVDPNRSDNDISGGTSNIQVILGMFAQAHRILRQMMDNLHHADLQQRRGQSILGCILAGDYDAYEVQRKRLRELYDQQRYSR